MFAQSDVSILVKVWQKLSIDSIQKLFNILNLVTHRLHITLHPSVCQREELVVVGEGVLPLPDHPGPGHQTVILLAGHGVRPVAGRDLGVEPRDDLIIVRLLITSELNLRPAGQLREEGIPL